MNIADDDLSVVGVRAFLHGGADSPDGESLLNLGARLHAKGVLEGALIVFERAVYLAPDCLSAWHALASVRFQLTLYKAALDACNHALALAPLDVSSLFNAGVVLGAMGDDAAAVHCYQKVLGLAPAHHGALLNRIPLLARLERLPEAIEAGREALACLPNDSDVIFNFGDVLLASGRYEEALDAFEHARFLRPECARTALAVAFVLAALGRVPEARGVMVAASASDTGAIDRFRSPLAADRDSLYPEFTVERVAILAGFDRLQQEGWGRRDAFVALYRKLVIGDCGGTPLNNPDLPYFSLGLPVADDIRRQVARNTAARVTVDVAGVHLVRRKRRADARIHIGYVSGDVRRHAAERFAAGLYSRHDRSRFKIHLYSTGPDDGSAERLRAKNSVEIFRDMARFGGEVLAQAAAYDGIDILVNLSGYTAFGRPGAFALRAAPVQVNYVGFMGTLGAPWIDYAILDHQSLLPEVREYWDEKIAFLPDTLTLCERSLTYSSALPQREDVGVPPDAFVFCNFNLTRKLEPESFSLWMRVLKAVPDSVLWMVEESPECSDFLRREAELRGVAACRLVFAPLLPYREHLARYSLADVFLDSLAYNCHVTCADALLMGVPVLTCPGRDVVARGASSLLMAHGLPELVVASEDLFVEAATRLASDVGWRAQIGCRVRDMESSRLFCPEQRIREIEQAYETMWARHLQGLPPADFDVPRFDG